MEETSGPIDLLPFAKRVHASLQKQQKVRSKLYENWLIDVYFGPVPSVDSDLPRLGHTACAQTQDIEAGPLPDVNASNGVRVDFDRKSIVWWSGETLDTLLESISTAFPDMDWDNKEDSNVDE